MKTNKDIFLDIIDNAVYLDKPNHLNPISIWNCKKPDDIDTSKHFPYIDITIKYIIKSINNKIIFVKALPYLQTFRLGVRS